MPRHTEIIDEEDSDITLQMECWSEELSPAQLAAFESVENEYNSVRNKLNDVVKKSGSENIFSGELFSAYQVSGDLEKIGKPLAEYKKILKDDKAKAQAQLVAATTSTRSSRAIAKEKEVTKRRDYSRSSEKPVESLHEIDDAFDDDDDDYIPLSKKMNKSKEVVAPVKKDVKKVVLKNITPEKIVNVTPALQVRPSELTAIGGLTVGETPASTSKKLKEVVDLTKDDGGKVTADSREVSFNKLQGKTYPSLVVVARPTLKVKDSSCDRGALDAKVKSVLMLTASKFTEWCIQQGLVRSEQNCLIHSSKALKLGQYSDAAKFPYSGGYVWISDCCKQRFVSVFCGSLFEGSAHPPSVLLKLVYHWSCQTMVQNVTQWVKVDNLYVKGLFTWLRAVCTVALHQHLKLLGGPGRRIEVGVISLGTTTQTGQQRQVRVEVLGVLDPDGKLVRLRAIEPLTDGERNFKKRFTKLLEPLAEWVHKDSIIITDLTVDKGTLNSLGYKNVHQPSSSTTSDAGRNTNANIMDYLRKIVPRMFQNTLSLLSRQIIQQFLDELVWREWYGTSPGQAFDNIVLHISEQIRADVDTDTLVNRLNKVAANPFKNWSHLSASPSTSVKRRKRPESSTIPAIIPVVINAVKKEKVVEKKEIIKQIKPVEKKIVKKLDEQIGLEDFYYALHPNDVKIDIDEAVTFNVECPECKEPFTKNTTFLKHLLLHAAPVNDTISKIQCIYCLEHCTDEADLDKHLLLVHPLETKNSVTNSFNCIICETRHSTIIQLSTHLQKTHFPVELPYKCGGCDYSSSSHRVTIDHYYEKHSLSGILQCPFCLKIFTAANGNGEIIENVKTFLDHLKRHLNKSQSKKCNRCSLWFMQKGMLKTHQLLDHVSQSNKKRFLKSLCSNKTNIAKPKPKSASGQKDALPFTIIDFYNKSLKIVLDDGKMCLECGSDFDENNHLTNFMKCSKCKFHTVCLPTMLEHSSFCNSGVASENSFVSPLEMEMHCICGFSSSDGNAMARHLVSCDRRSAYPTHESAQENIVKRNMLDMLGLVRRDDENDQSSDDVVMEGTSTDLDTNISNENPTEAYEEQQFTQMSLDDLGPPSVMVSHMPEPDRTPQLKDYQSLTTPRVPHMESAMNDNEDYENPPPTSQPMEQDLYNM